MCGSRISTEELNAQRSEDQSARARCYMTRRQAKNKILLLKIIASLLVKDVIATMSPMRDEKEDASPTTHISIV